jgi:hypothetical protein
MTRCCRTAHLQHGLLAYVKFTDQVSRSRFRQAGKGASMHRQEGNIIWTTQLERRRGFLLNQHNLRWTQLHHQEQQRNRNSNFCFADFEPLRPEECPRLNFSKPLLNLILPTIPFAYSRHGRIKPTSNEKTFHWCSGCLDAVQFYELIEALVWSKFRPLFGVV